MKKAILFSGLQAQNTFIGGIGATTNTANLLATLLGISVSRISNFEVVGSEVRCRIFGYYTLPQDTFQNSTTFLYFNDKDGLVDNSIRHPFRGSTKAEYLNFRGLLSCSEFTFSDITGGKLKHIYIPRCTNLGGSVLDNNVFRNINNGCKIYVPDALRTCNAGNPDGDLAYAILQGAKVTYVTNFDKPSTPTFTLTGGVYGTTIQINDIVCMGTNAIDFYEVWINGSDSGQTIKASGDYIINLIVNTSYDIQLVARDIFYNESEISSKVTASTKDTYFDFSTILTNYYNLNSNINDSKGSINGTNYGGTFTTGKVSNALTLDGTSQYATLPDNDAFSFPDDSDFSINFCDKLDTLNNFQWLLNKRDGELSNIEWQILYSSTYGVVCNLFSENATTSFRTCRSNNLLTAGVFYDITVSYKSGNFKIFVNGLNNSTVVETGTYVKMTNTTSKVTIGKFGWNTGGYFKGQLDCLAFFKGTALTQGHASDIKAIHDSGNDLI